MPVAVVTRLWLLGHGVQHSPSPAFQNAALAACGLPWTYQIHDVAPDSLPDALAALRSGGIAGANVTIPHKRAVAEACDELVGDAAQTGAVNTVVARDGRLIGHNTDARGFENALRHEGLWPTSGGGAVILGAGGAAAAVALALSRAGVRVEVAARTQPAALQNVSLEKSSLDWNRESIHNALAGLGTSLLVNATPAPLRELPIDVASLPSNCTIVDLRYRYMPDDLIPTARARGLRATDGLEMLLQQGMLSFQLWTGVADPPYDVARDALRTAVHPR